MNKLLEINSDRILYVDDQQENLMLFELMFAGKFNVVSETNPLIALELIKNNRFEIVISDYMMPEMNGIEFLEIVKNEYPEIIRIMLTSNIDYELEIEVKRRCDCEFFTKPLNKNIIEKKLIAKTLL